MKMTRRQFLGTAALTTAVAACGGDEPGPDANLRERSCSVNGTVVAIEPEHGHTLTVTASDVSTGVEKTYVVADGTAGHSHMVTITAANFATLQSNANGSIMATSTSTAGHSHTVRVFCATA